MTSEGSRTFARRLALSLRLGLAIETAVSYANLGERVAFFEGLEAGRGLIVQGLEFAKRRGLTHHVMWSRASLLPYSYELGEWDEVLRESEEIVSWDREHGGTQIEILALTVRASILAQRGRIDEAARDTAVVLPRAREIADPQVLAPALILGALVSALRGRLAEAVAQVEEFAHLADLPRAEVFAGASVVTRICVAAGRAEVAERLVQELSGAPGPVARNSLACSRALLCEARGELDEAARLYREGAEGWAEWGSVVEHAYALLGLWRCAGDEGARREAEAVFGRLGAVPFTALAAA